MARSRVAMPVESLQHPLSVYDELLRSRHDGPADARIAEFCEQLKLVRLASEWPGLGQDAAKTEASFADFLEKVLECEIVGRDERTARRR